jgi:hypothetical protein
MLQRDRKLQLLAPRVTMKVWDTSSLHNFTTTTRIRMLLAKLAVHTWDSHRGAAEDSSLQDCYTTQTGNYLLTLRKVVVFISRVKLLKEPTVVQTVNSHSFTVNYCVQKGNSSDPILSQLNLLQILILRSTYHFFLGTSGGKCHTGYLCVHGRMILEQTLNVIFHLLFYIIVLFRLLHPSIFPVLAVFLSTVWSSAVLGTFFFKIYLLLWDVQMFTWISLKLFKMPV